MAAGKGTRMGSNIPKPLIKIHNITIIEVIIDSLNLSEIERIGVVVSPENHKLFESVLQDKVDYILQNDQRGTGHAVMVAKEWLKDFSGNLIVTVGDTPFISKEVFEKLLNRHNKAKNTCTFLSTTFEDKIPPYGRILRDMDGNFITIKEELDASEEELKIREVITSQYCFDVDELFDALNKTKCHNVKKEYYLCDVLEIFKNQNKKIEVVQINNPLYTFGVNIKEDISKIIKEVSLSSNHRIITNSVPGRICLFGEHQDYLKLPVITSAINLRVEIKSKSIDEKVFIINLPDINSKIEIPFEENSELEYEKERDYFRSCYNVLLRKGLNLKKGIECTVIGNIPINSGTSSSSALNNCWIKTLIEYDQKFMFRSDENIAEMAYLAEVIEFNEPGGMMDQYATAIGGLLHISFDQNDVKVKSLKNNFKTFVLGDSLEPKDTKFILSNVKNKVLSAVEKIQKIDILFSLKTFTIEDIENYKNILTEREIEVLEAAYLNRNITSEILSLINQDELSDYQLGSYLNKLHQILDTKLNISTKKINRMLSASLKAGALGGKINGSGGGGCMFVYAPNNPENIVKAIENEGGKGYIIKSDRGIKINC